MKPSIAGLVSVWLIAGTAATFAQTPSEDKAAEKKASRKKPAGRRLAPARPQVHPRQKKYDPFDDGDEAPRHRAWFPVPFLGLPLGDVVEQGSRGIDEAFKHTAVANPIRYSSTGDTTTDNPIQSSEDDSKVEPMPRPAIPVANPWEMVSSEGKITDSNGSVCHYVWKLVIKNNADHDLVLTGGVAFVDQDGLSVDSSPLTVLRVAAHAQQEFTGSKMMMADAAQTIVKPLIQISEK